MLEQETRNRANSEAQRFLIDDDPSPGGQEASWPPSQHSTPQQGTSTPARTPNQTPSQTPGPSPGLGGLRAMFSGVDSTPPQGFSTPSPGAPARAPSGDLQWESGSDIVIGDSPGGGAPPPERRMPSATAPTGGGRDGSGWEVGQGAAQDPWGHAEGPPGPSASMGDDDMPWQSYRPVSKAQTHRADSDSDGADLLLRVLR